MFSSVLGHGNNRFRDTVSQALLFSFYSGLFLLEYKILPPPRPRHKTSTLDPIGPSSECFIYCFPPHKTSWNILTFLAPVCFSPICLLSHHRAKRTFVGVFPQPPCCQAPWSLFLSHLSLLLSGTQPTTLFFWKLSPLSAPVIHEQENWFPSHVTGWSSAPPCRLVLAPKS